MDHTDEISVISVLSVRNNEKNGLKSFSVQKNVVPLRGKM